MLWKLYQNQETKQKQWWRTMPWACLVLNIGKRWFLLFLCWFYNTSGIHTMKNNYFIRHVGKVVELSIIVRWCNKIICLFIVCIQNVLWNLHKTQKRQKCSNVENEADSNHSSPTFALFDAAFITLFNFQLCFVLFL